MVAARQTPPTEVDGYISRFPPDVQSLLEQIRETVRSNALGAKETISYQMPAFMLHGALVYFAAFNKHIGFYPPVSGDARLQRALARYANAKGNLQFPLNQPIPYGLIERIVRLRVKQNLAKAAAKQTKARSYREARRKRQLS